MATYPVVMTNPGAELNSLSGWSTLQTGDISYSGATAGAARTGSYGFSFYPHPLENLGTDFYNTPAIDAARHATIDVSGFIATIKGWQRNDAAGGTFGRIYVEFLNAAMGIISTVATSYINSPNVWTQRTISTAVPPLTRHIRVHADMYHNPGASIVNHWDDFSIDLEEVVSAAIDAHQLGSYAVGSYYSHGVDNTQLGAVAVVSSETSNGLFDFRAHQLGAYALVRKNPDSRILRAWTFTQDDHDFYVLHLAEDETLVWDKLTKQWSSFKTAGRDCWRAADGVLWEEDNVACDMDTGVIWNISPDHRMDDYSSGLAEDQTPIVTVTTGFYAERLRATTPCYRAGLVVAQGDPAEAGVGIRLRTSDDDETTWIDHGTFIPVDGTRRDYDISWSSLGLIGSPGRVFEITDYGYTARIDALDIDIGPEQNG
jgi:hypothetical protein